MSWGGGHQGQFLGQQFSKCTGYGAAEEAPPWCWQDGGPSFSPITSEEPDLKQVTSLLNFLLCKMDPINLSHRTVLGHQGRNASSPQGTVSAERSLPRAPSRAAH